MNKKVISSTNDIITDTKNFREKEKNIIISTNNLVPKDRPIELEDVQKFKEKIWGTIKTEIEEQNKPKKKFYKKDKLDAIS